MTEIRQSRVDVHVAHLRAVGPEPANGARLISAEWGSRGTLIRFENRFCEYLCGEENVERLYIDAGAPIRRAHDDYSIEGQIGMLRDIEPLGHCVRFIGQLGHNALSETILRDCRAGIAYGCSVGAKIIEEHEVLDIFPPLDLPVFRVTRWAPIELTITALQFGRDSFARVSWARDIDTLLQARQRAAEMREAADLRKLPEGYADPLRARLPAIAKSVATKIGYFDVSAIENALCVEMEAAFAQLL